MKRFWTNAEAVEAEGGWTVTLDGRAIKTPARAALVVPTRALAEAIAAEWDEVADEVDPRAMPITGLANAAIDRVAPVREAFAADLARYGNSELCCYRADHPDSLCAAQARAWDPLLDWAGRRYDVAFATTGGLMHVEQPAETVARLVAAVAAEDAFALAALSPLVTIGGSLVAALAVREGVVSPEDAYEAVEVDARHQAEHWGADAEAEQRDANRRADFLAAARFLTLL